MLRLSCSLVPLLLLTPPLSAQVPSAERPPIIEMHLHAERGTSGQSWEEALAALDTQNIVLAMLSVDDSAGARWHETEPERFWIGPAFPCYEGRFPAMDPCFEEGEGWPDLEWLRRQYESGRMRTMGEMLYVYYGIPPTDERLEPYWALADELDIPVGVHIGRGPPPQGRASGCCPNFNDDFGDPSLLEPVLQRHPGLRLWLMHAPGAPEFMDGTIALMKEHPNVYAEMSIVNSIAPETAHAGALRAFLDAGLEDRIMFGSDNMPLGPIVERIEAVPFLTAEQRRAIYCDNAARFLRLGAQVCAATAPSIPESEAR